MILLSSSPSCVPSSSSDYQAAAPSTALTPWIPYKLLLSHAAPCIRSSSHGAPFPGRRRRRRRRSPRRPLQGIIASSAAASPLEALIFDCDGVILESEDLHRQAYNAAFSHFNVICPHSNHPLHWNSEFYDQLQNQIGGGKPKMRWYFNKHGWPSSTITNVPPVTDAEKVHLVDALQDWKTEKYKDILGSGTVTPRPGVLRLMDESKAKGVKLAVCSAATKSSVIFCLTNLLGKVLFEELDCFLAGDDVQEKKPSPLIYQEAVKKLQVPAEQCLVIEDSVIGLQAALGAGISCIISYTSSTCNQDFTGARAVFSDLATVSLNDLVELMESVQLAPS